MEMVSKPCQDRLMYPILVKSANENKENSGSQMGHTKKYNFKKKQSKRYLRKLCTKKYLKNFI